MAGSTEAELPSLASPIAAESATKQSIFSALASSPAFRRLWLGAVITALGQWMQATALGWTALSLTDSEAFVGLVGLMSGLPFLLVGLPAGMIIDRFDRRVVLMSCQASAAVLAVFVAIDVIAGTVEPWHLLVVAFVSGGLQATLSPTQQSLVPNLIRREEMVNALGLMSAGGNMTRVVGPAIAGGIIGVAGSGAAFVLQACALVTAFALIKSASFPKTARASGPVRLSAVFDGLRIVVARPDLRALFLIAIVPTFFVFPYVSFLSVFARDLLKIGPSGLGLLMATSGIGAVIGSLLVAARRQTSGAGIQLIVLTFVYGFVIVGVGLSASLLITLPLLVAAGAIGATMMSSNNVLIQHRITDDVRGRVMGAYMLTWGLMPVGAMPMGLVADQFGMRAAVVSGALISSGIALIVGLTSRDLRRI